MITKRIDARIEATQASGFWDVRRQLGFSYLWITALMLYNDHPSAPHRAANQGKRTKQPRRTYKLRWILLRSLACLESWWCLVARFGVSHSTIWNLQVFCLKRCGTAEKHTSWPSVAEQAFKREHQQAWAKSSQSLISTWRRLTIADLDDGYCTSCLLLDIRIVGFRSCFGTAPFCFWAAEFCSAGLYGTPRKQTGNTPTTWYVSFRHRHNISQYHSIGVPPSCLPVMWTQSSDLHTREQRCASAIIIAFTTNPRRANNNKDKTSAITMENTELPNIHSQHEHVHM